MKMIQAVVRPERDSAVTSALAKANYPGLTKWDVVGRGRQQGIQVGTQMYDELAKTMVMVVVQDDQVEAVIEIIQSVAFSGYPGDGKIFVAPVESAFTIRTGKAEL